MTGDLGELLNGFNRMATQLENYDEGIQYFMIQEQELEQPNYI